MIYADLDSSARTPSPPPSHLPPPIQSDHHFNTQVAGQRLDVGDTTPTNIICCCRLCRGTFRRPSDIVHEHQLINRLHSGAPPSNTRADQPMVTFYSFKNSYFYMIYIYIY